MLWALTEYLTTCSSTYNTMPIAQVILRTTLCVMVTSFKIEIALAGVAKEDLEITLADGVLTIEHNPEGEVEPAGWSWIHKGIAQRKFKRNFTLSDDIVVNGSRMENGMLYIELERIVPEEKKPRQIEIK